MFCAVFIDVACDVAVSVVASVDNDVDVDTNADADRTLESVQRHLAAIFLTIQWFFRAADFVVLLFIELLLLPQQSESESESHRMMLHLLPIAGKPKFLSSFWHAPIIPQPYSWFVTLFQQSFDLWSPEQIKMNWTHGGTRNSVRVNT